MVGFANQFIIYHKHTHTINTRQWFCWGAHKTNIIMFASIILLGEWFHHVVLYFLNAIFVSESSLSFKVSAYLPPFPSYCPPAPPPSLFSSFVISFTPVIKRDCISSIGSSSSAYVTHATHQTGCRIKVSHKSPPACTSTYKSFDLDVWW